MLLPNLFVPGAAKSGTSSLHDYLGQHPEVFMSRIKEPHFFSNNVNFQQNYREKLQAYADLFAGSDNFKIRGESSTGYMVFPHVVERIRSIVPEARFIFLLRNPIDRAYSHYWWLRGRGFESRSFREAVMADMNDLPDPDNRVIGFGGYRYYYQFGRYGTYLRPFIDAFGREKIFVFTSEELRTATKAAVNRCFEFLGCSSLATMKLTRVNETIVYTYPRLSSFFHSFGAQTAFSSILKHTLSKDTFRRILAFRRSLLNKLDNRLKAQTSYPVMSREDREWLRDLYEDEVALLRQITQIEFSEWWNDFPTQTTQLVDNKGETQ